MNYVQLIEKMKSGLGKLYKMALDLAAILDSAAAQVTEDASRGWEGPREQRLRTFNLLCAICVKANIAPPNLEEGLWRGALPRTYNKDRFEQARKVARETRLRVRKHLKGQTRPAANMARALMETINLFPDCDGFTGINKENIMAMLNRLLVDELSLAPFRPDYSAMTIPDVLHADGSARPATVVIVDDDPNELLKSALTLIGIPNLAVKFVHYKSASAWNKPQGQELQNKLLEVARSVLELTPDVIVMDQGLGDIEGSDLVTTIKNQNPEHRPIFVANTGGDPNKLLNAGCLDNFEKGRAPKSIRQAISAVN